MNAIFGFVSLTLDSQLCGKFCLTLAHSIWQLALLAILAVIVSKLWKARSVEASYLVHVAALLLGLAALPLTYVLVDVTAPAVASREVFSGVDVPSSREQFGDKPMENAVPVIAKLPKADIDTLTPDSIAKPRAASWLLSFAPWFMACYAAGVALMMLRLALAFWKSQRIASRATAITTGPLFDALQTLARQWSVRVAPTLAQVEQIIMPQVVGFLQPMILLPTSAITGLTALELQMILTHELAHVRRFDMWINLVQRLAETVLFFNPGLWFLSRRISTLREYCCDEQTCRVASHETSAARLHYAQALLRVVELSGRQFPQAELTALAATGRSPSELRRRVARLFGEPLREPVQLSRGAVLTILAGIALLMVGPLTWQMAAEPGKESSPTAQDSIESDNSTRKFSFGGEMEVVAIGTHGEEQQRWWNAEGKELDSLPFTWKRKARVTSADKVWRRIIFRIEGLPKDADVSWDITNSGASGEGELTFNDSSMTGVYFSRFFGLAENQKSFGLRVGIATGGWKSVASSNSGGSSSFGLPLNKGIVFSEAISITEKTIVVVSHNYNESDSRVVAIDKQWNMHVSQFGGGAGAAGINQTSHTFQNLQLPDIDHFEFQTRDYEWVEIKDLPVEPGKRDDEKSSSWQKVFHFFEGLAEDANSGLIEISSEESTKNPLSHLLADRSDNLTRYEILSKKKLFKLVEDRFDAHAGYYKAFEGVLEGLQRDPFGPQVNVREVAQSFLGNDLSLLSVQGQAENISEEQFLFAWSTKNSLEVKRALFQFFRADKNASLITINNQPVWQVAGNGQPLLASCVTDNHLIITNDLPLLEKVLNSENSASRNRWRSE